jgi:hypothetical protein
MKPPKETMREDPKRVVPLIPIKKDRYAHRLLY